ncbi:MAG: hypothetical protein F6K47_10065 [Symploca sp. SIO2E6]|nr:hypothetical protein [Symploca sp. SIO2E6]
MLRLTLQTRGRGDAGTRRSFYSTLALRKRYIVDPPPVPLNKGEARGCYAFSSTGSQRMLRF